MAMIVDTLVQYGDEAYTFTVNTAVDSVAIAKIPGSTEVLSIGGVFNTFQWKDKLTLLSVGAILPLGFDFYPTVRVPQGDFWPNHVSLNWRRVSDGAIFTFQPNRYNLFGANYESSIGAYLEPPETIGENFQLTGSLALSQPCNISMINVPAALDGETFPVQIYAKVGHTLPMV